uniref:Uncharacterized protein n=1 Tax=Anguilla anguilla TaxID=7936 RepID=A0A0E9RW75_ANGAN
MTAQTSTSTAMSIVRLLWLSRKK